MSRRGLIFRMAIREKPPEYIAMQFFIGIWEHQVNNLNPEFIRDMEEYGPILFNHKTWKKTPQLRTIPVRQSITPQLEVMSYEKAEEMVWDKKRAVVAPCICRRERKIMGEGCEKPEDACLVFGMGAVYYQRNGFGRAIDRQEVLDILKTADKAGLVLQPGNSKDIANICCCCGCCCAILKNMKLHPRPAELVLSAFLAEIHTESCTGCGVCVKRCQMDALRKRFSMRHAVSVADSAFPPVRQNRSNWSANRVRSLKFLRILLKPICVWQGCAANSRLRI